MISSEGGTQREAPNNQIGKRMNIKKLNNAIELDVNKLIAEKGREAALIELEAEVAENGKHAPFAAWAIENLDQLHAA